MIYEKGDWILILWINAGESLHPLAIEGFPTEESARQAGQKWVQDAAGGSHSGINGKYSTFQRPAR